MIQISNISFYDNSPWEIPINKRIEYAKKAVMNNRKLAIHFYEQADSSTFRYRCYNVMQALITSESWASTYFFLDELESIGSIIPLMQLPIITRIRWSPKLDNFIYSLRLRGLPIIYDVDDLIFDLDKLLIVRNTLNSISDVTEINDAWVALTGRHQMTATLADAYTTTNKCLGYELSHKFGKHFEIVPNTLNREQISISKLILNEKTQNKSIPPFTIGYFSGTPTHINDFKVVYRELMMLLDKYPNIYLKIVGYMDLPTDMQPYLDSNRIKIVPLVDFIELQRQIASVDINIAPLIQNSFTNSKSELKFFEAAIVNTITVASPIYSFKNSIVNGVNGFLCEEGEWFEVLEKIYLKQVDTYSIIEKARQDVLNVYTPENFSRIVTRVYDKLEQKLC